jgi:putative ABC transport system substrate-binding protein
VELHVVKISPTEKLETAFAGLARTEPKALLIAPSSYFNTHSQQIGQLTVHHKIPAIYQLREFAAAGGLMSYGASLTHAYNTVGLYTGRVLKGTQPADLPVQQQTRLDFIINLRTAKTLGLSLPNSLVARADEVIE